VLIINPLLPRFYEPVLIVAEALGSMMSSFFAVFWNDRTSTVGVLQGCFDVEKQFAFD
jgi:hypothetical protein